eukprot:9562969-Lingulodinium_polyedra.AAC.1
MRLRSRKFAAVSQPRYCVRVMLRRGGAPKGYLELPPREPELLLRRSAVPGAGHRCGCCATSGTGGVGIGGA